MKVKVCGMTQVNQVKGLEELGVDFAGFIFHKASPRYVLNGIENARLLKNENLHLLKVGVFVNESLENITSAVKDWGLDMAQLHGDETPDFCKLLNMKVPTIKVFRIGTMIDPILFSEYGEVADYFLFDTLGQQYGGTGKQFDWELISSLDVVKPFFLSGGIGPDDVAKINDFCNKSNSPEAIDLNSKFEISPGKKDLDRLSQFLSLIHKK